MNRLYAWYRRQSWYIERPIPIPVIVGLVATAVILIVVGVGTWHALL